MEDEGVDQALRGFRSRWIDRSKQLGDISEDHVDSAASGYSPSINLEDPIESLDGNFSDAFRDNAPKRSDAGSCQAFEVIPDDKQGSTCSQTAAEVMTTSAFVRNASWSNLALPWETDFMSQIFSETSVPDPKLSLPSQWTERRSRYGQSKQTRCECAVRSSRVSVLKTC